jgi:hypothetical protein
LNQLVRGERLAELSATPRVGDGFVERAPRHPAGRRADRRAKRAERRHREAKSIALRAHAILCGHAQSLKLDLADRVRRDETRALAHLEAVHARADDEGGNLRAAVGATARAREDRVEICQPGVGDETLAPVEHVAVAVAPRGGLNRRHVRADLRFGQGESGDGTTRRGARQPEVAHVFGRGERDGVRAESLHHEGEIGERRGIGKLLANQAERAHVERRVRPRHRVAQQLGLRQQRDQLAKLLIRLRLIRLLLVALGARLDLAPHETGDTRREPQMLRREKRRLFDKSIHKNSDE